MSTFDRREKSVSEETVGEDDFRLQVSKDKMAVHLDCDTEGKNPLLLADAIVAKLAHFGVPQTPSASWLANWLQDQALESKVLDGAVIVRGMPPIPPVDGHMAWTADFFNKNFVWDEKTDRVDFRHQAGQRNVKAGQLLGVLHRARRGEDGYDVLGKTIRVRNPTHCRVRAGANVRLDDEEHSYYSKIDGRIRFSHGVLAVDNHYKVRGDVGLKTGDISHSGSVLVTGDVLEGARLEAVGDIEVMGAVESAHVQTGGSLIVHGGITGAVGSRVVAAGGVTARYILDGDVQAGDDVVVEREIVQSTVRTRGAVYMPTGRIVGGSILALEGVEVRQIGSTASVKSQVVAGEDFCLKGELRIIRGNIEKTKENIAHIRATIEPLRGKVAALTTEKKRIVKILLDQLKKLETQLVVLGEEDVLVREHSQARERHVIFVRGTIFPETRLQIHGVRYRARDTFPGPVKPVLVEGEVRISPTTMLSLRGGRKKE